jgi:sodium-dependent phosphate cotransporter
MVLWAAIPTPAGGGLKKELVGQNNRQFYAVACGFNGKAPLKHIQILITPQTLRWELLFLLKVKYNLSAIFNSLLQARINLMKDKNLLDTNLIEPASTEATPYLPASTIDKVADVTRTIWHRVRPDKIAIFMVSLFLFILAIMLMKEGARGLTFLVRDTFDVSNPINSLGFGWLFAYVIMSGSPVAAVALTFFDAGVIDKLGAFTMITGSRLGASFIVLFIGFIYVVRGRNRASSLGMGLLSLTVTGTTYLIGLVIGLGMLQSGVLDNLQLRSGAVLNSVTDLIFDPITAFFIAYLPRWALFVVGLGLIMLSFSLFDRCLPEMSIKESQVGRMSRLVYRPWVMFLMGAGVTLISMSVSISLSILIPLSNRGFVRRENVIPYIMGANITTFVDTLLAAVLLDNPPAFTVVLVEMISITIVSVIILTTGYHRYERAMLDFVNWATARKRNLAIFMAIIFVVPIILVLV